MNSRKLSLSLSLSALMVVAVVFASNGVINVLSTNQVSNEKDSKGFAITGYRWEPSTAAGSTWATSWATFVGSASTTYVSAWNGGWLGPFPIAPPDGSIAVDLNLGWDSVRSFR